MAQFLLDATRELRARLVQVHDKGAPIFSTVAHDTVDLNTLLLELDPLTTGVDGSCELRIDSEGVDGVTATLMLPDKMPSRSMARRVALQQRTPTLKDRLTIACDDLDLIAEVVAHAAREWFQ